MSAPHKGPCGFSCPPDPPAAQMQRPVEKDADVSFVRAFVYAYAPGGIKVGQNTLAVLDRIERRLEAGKAHAEIVEACIEAGHIEAVKP